MKILARTILALSVLIANCLLVCSLAYASAQEGRIPPSEAAPVPRPKHVFDSSKTKGVAFYVPAFDSSDALGMNVATIFNLRLWSTLRWAPYPDNPKKINFGRGIIYWGGSPLSSHQETIRYMKDASTSGESIDGVMWGKTWRLNDGVVVQVYLSLNEGQLGPAFDRSGNIWSIRLKEQSNEFLIQADVPNRFYEFAPVILEPSIVDKYSSPTSIKIYRAKNWKDQIGTLQVDFDAKEVGKEWAYVISGKNRGYINLPFLSKDRSEIVDFVGGVIRCFRQDWKGSISLMKSVASEESHAPTALKIDALLYMALSKERLGEDSQAELNAAYQMNPYNKTTVVYRIMSQLESIRRTESTHDQLAKHKASAVIRQILENHGSMFSTSEPWLIKVRDLINYVEAG